MLRLSISASCGLGFVLIAAIAEGPIEDSHGIRHITIESPRTLGVRWFRLAK